VAKGIKVTALIAYANRGGEKLLRKLEMRFLDAGLIVARTADDLVRYHDKLIIVDRRMLYLLSFNFTHVDIDRSRAFGIATRNVRLVHEAARLFEADCTRTPYVPEPSSLVVSPANARKVLGEFIRRAKHQLLIYDPEISDRDMLRLLGDRVKAGVDVRIIGNVDRRAKLPVAGVSKPRLHTRTIIRDRHQAFIGSQSLRAIELDSRRELGLIFREPRIVKTLIDTFESDWTAATSEKQEEKPEERRGISQKEDVVAKTLVKELRPLATTLKRAVRRTVARAGSEALENGHLKDTVKKVVKRAVKEAVQEVAKEAPPA
jgi:cardiolipin synthase A/B